MPKQDSRPGFWQLGWASGDEEGGFGVSCLFPTREEAIAHAKDITDALVLVEAKYEDVASQDEVTQLYPEDDMDNIVILRYVRVGFRTRTSEL
jgi:hypothetical protein